MADVSASVLTDALRDRYVLERELGRGGMATVYLARDLKHDRPVALKVLRPELAASLGPERFQREIRFAARLQHPHILSVHDSGEAAGQLWFTMPYVEGESLRTRLTREGQLSIEAALRITCEAAQALQYAHEHQVIHRDIKPENLLLTTDGNTLVADFGIARALGGDERLTETGLSLGTPRYMSPEQASADRALDARTDVYSLGCVLYEMLAGHPPFLGSTAREVLARHALDPVPPLRAARGTVPEAVERSVMKALAKAPVDRFATVAQFAQALTPSVTTAMATPTIVPAVAPQPLAPGPIATQAREGRRRIAVRLGTLGIGFALALGVLFAWRRTHQGSEVAGPKHLAVLPFENQGDSADAYFADGVTDELRGKLATLPGLEVVASRSSNDYRHTTKSLPQIARELQVDYLLIGKIRWQKAVAGAGAGRVRVSPELVKVARGAAPTTKWEQPVDAALTDVFQVQADIASRVAEALNLALATGVPQALATRPTTSTEAYDDYLRANDYFNRQTVPDMRIAIQLYHRALALDSTFALAWARLARAEAYLYWYRADLSAEQVGRVEQAARRALSLAPELPEAHVAVGYYYYWGRYDYVQALEEFALAGQREPNNAEVVHVIGLILRRQGKWEQGLASLRRATELDPRSYPYLVGLGDTYLAMRAYPEAERVLDRARALGPDLPSAYGSLALLYLNWEGSVDKPRRILQEARTRMDFGRIVGIALHDRTSPRRAGLSLIASDDAYQPDVARLTPASFEGDTLAYFGFRASVYRYRREQAKARAYDDSARTESLTLIPRHEDDVFTYATLAVADAYLGRGKEAIEAGQRAVAILPPSKDALDGQAGPRALAVVYTVLGDTAAAVGQLEALLAVPSFLSAARLRVDPTWAPLRGNPRFELLVAGK